MLEIGSKIADRAVHFILPIVAYSVTGIASLAMLMKNSLLENLGHDYVRTAFAKGLREKRVIWMHAMRNSIIPLAARAGFVITVFLAGSFLIEYVFNIEGIGKLSYMAILSRDYPIVFAFTVIGVTTLLLGNIISDFILAVVDPRIRFK
jgi:microcin C transport system permease protein